MSLFESLTVGQSGEKFAAFCCSRNFFFVFYRIPPLGPLQSRINQVHIARPNPWRIQLNFILPSAPQLHKFFFLLRSFCSSTLQHTSRPSYLISLYHLYVTKNSKVHNTCGKSHGIFANMAKQNKESSSKFTLRNEIRKICWSSNVYWTVHHCNSWGMKNQLDVTCYFIPIIMRSTYFGHINVRNMLSA